MKARNFVSAVALSIIPVVSWAGSLDDPIVEPAPMVVSTPAGPNWSGFYAGAQLGWGWAEADADIAGASVSNDGDQWLGGFHGGYRRDFGRFVGGVEAAYDWTDVDLDGDGINGASIDSVWRVGLTGGFEIGSGLLYASGGWADAGADGWYAGLGYARPIGVRSIASLEWLYHEFDNAGDADADINLNTVALRWSYRF